MTRARGGGGGLCIVYLPFVVLSWSRKRALLARSWQRLGLEVFGCWIVTSLFLGNRVIRTMAQEDLGQECFL